MSSKIYDVLIVGAGPVGLFLACELGLAGNISVLVLDRDPNPSNSNIPWKLGAVGVRGINTVSAESLHRRGLLEQTLGPEAWAKRPMDLEPRGMSGHFAGMQFDASKVNRSASCWKYKLSGPALLPSMTSLQKITNALYPRTQELGVEVRGGMDVTGVTQDEERGEVVVHTANDDEFRGKWLVGCDGGRSKVRKAGGFDFVGTEPELSGYTVQCDIDDPDNEIKKGFVRTPTGMYATMMPGHIVTVEPISNNTHGRNDDITKEDFERIVRRVTGNHNISIKSMGLALSWTDRAKQATRYRKGRVLLAGDSAHIHSPLGGQGLNAGIGDAMNLGWKLAGVVKDPARQDLLDTYERERHPLGAWITEWTRAQVTTLKPGLHNLAVANLIKDLIATSDGVTHMTDKFWGLTQRYDLSTDDNQQPHPLVGCSVPDFDFADGSGRLGERQRTGHGLIIDFGGNDAALRSLAKKWHSIDYVQERAKDELGFKALLIRPDGIVVWVAETEVELEKAEAALRRWFSPAT